MSSKGGGGGGGGGGAYKKNEIKKENGSGVEIGNREKWKVMLSYIKVMKGLNKIKWIFLIFISNPRSFPFNSLPSSYLCCLSHSYHFLILPPTHLCIISWLGVTIFSKIIAETPPVDRRECSFQRHYLIHTHPNHMGPFLCNGVCILQSDTCLQ